MNRLFLSKLVCNLFHWSKRDHFNRFIAEQNRAGQMDRNELAAFRQKKLNTLLREALMHVPYYRDCAGENLSRWLEKPDLTQFPILTKEVIRKNFEALKHENIQDLQASKSSTSGSTGESLFFMLSKHTILFSDAVSFRNFKYMGAHPLAPQAILWGARFDQQQDTGLKALIKRCFKPFFFFSSYDMTTEKMAEMLRIIKDAKVEVLTSYPSPLEHFAHFVESQNCTFPHLKAIISSSEQLQEHQRELFKRVFGVEVFNRYGSREFGCIAHECMCHDRLHIEADHLFIEILDENLDPCPPGKLGELYITNLDNFAMPFIRYRIGDMAEWSMEESCPCGCNFPSLRRVEGRSFDLIKDRGGNVVSGTFWTLLTRYISEDITNFQVVQQEIDNATLYLVSNNMLTEPQETELRDKIREKLPFLEISIQYVSEIPLTKSGKRRFIISKLPQN